MNDLEVMKELEAQRGINQSLHTDLSKALEELAQANARIRQLEDQAIENQSLRTYLVQALESLSEASDRIKHLEDQAVEMQSLRTDLAQAQESLSEASARDPRNWKVRSPKIATTVASPPPAMVSKNPSAERKAYEKRVGKRAEGSRVTWEKPC